MSDTFLISDTHFGHVGILHFLNASGRRERPEFETVEEMDEYMVEKWNSVVKPRDKVYHLGDVAMKKKQLEIVKRLNGKKSLVMGNHDVMMASDYLKLFYNVRGIKVFDGHLFTHMPVRRGNTNVPERFTANVHGHIHSNKLVDPWYFNACVEHHNYTPQSWEVVKKKIAVAQNK